MKKIIYLFSVVAIALLTFACEDDYTRNPEGSVTPTAPVLAVGQNKVQISTLKGEILPTYLIRLNWSKARFTYANGLPSDVSDLKYTLQVDAAGEFPSPKEVIATDLLYEDLSSGELNDFILSIYGEQPEEYADLFFRVKTTYGSSEPVYSNLISLQVQYVSTDVPPTIVDEVTIQWKQVEGDWTEFAVYSWGGDPNIEAFGNWPGTVVEAGADGWYSVVVPGNRPINLILNNNGAGKQMNFLVNPDEDASYEINTTDGSFAKIDNPTGEIQIQWKQVEGDWPEFAIYAWGDRDFFGNWPGKVIQPNANGWYSVVIPERRNIHLILNNNGGGSQFDFLDNPTESGSYELHTAAGNNTSTFTKVDNPAQEITIRWKYVGSDWNAFGIYAWGGSPTGDTFGSWPGTVVTPDPSGWCSVTVPAGQTIGNVIFNNTNGGAGNQFDVKMNIISSVCFEITSDSFKVVDCQ